MTDPRTMTPGIRYVVNMIQAGMDGAVTARKAADVPQVLIRSVWAPTAIGAAVGASTASLSNRRRSGYGIAVGSLVGGVLGLGCAVAWVSRGFTGALARGALSKINIVRDARWLEKNPIDYA